ncbi:uncharacterized protein LOC133730370 [Rosa rugosa]|uniref:uncharacterized protein LOC133730370 n=1 Tax=Rosa rugosa TaxID=74645 RepID=UPI002B4073E1|nr:uncharacterized protein LOC133730370 [Rosa rugosa]
MTDSQFTTHVVFLLWFIWKERCNCVFNHISPNSLSVASRAFRASSEFLAIPTFISPKIHRPCNSEDSFHWLPPPVHSWKINTDAAWDSSTLSCGLSALLRDSTGTLVKGLSQSNFASSSLAAEAMAIDLGLSLASSIPLSSFQLESDSLVLISAFLNPLSAVDWSTSQIVSTIRTKASSFNRVNWRWTSRRTNAAADLVAAWASRRVCPVDWDSNPPPSLMRILLYDAAGPPP